MKSTKDYLPEKPKKSPDDIKNVQVRLKMSFVREIDKYRGEYSWQELFVALLQRYLDEEKKK